MGNAQSEYNENTDPCKPDLDVYLKCVSGYKNGMKEGEECEIEANKYKKCRQDQKKASKKGKIEKE